MQSAALGGEFSDTAPVAMTGDGGALTFSATPKSKTYCRVRFAGTSAHAASTSASVVVTPKVYLYKTDRP